MITPEPVEVIGHAGVRLVGDSWSVADSGPRRGHVLLLQGGGQTRHSWAGAAARIARHGWSAWAVDTRGHGDSQWAPDHDYGMDALVGDLVAIVAAIGERPVLVGASMGGMTALVAEGEVGGLARGLVLVDVTPRIETVGVTRITDFMRSGSDGFASLEEAAAAIASYNPHRPRPPRPEGLQKNLRLHDDGRWHWHWDPAFMQRVNREPDRNIGGDRPRDAARRITVPTLLVRGQQSDIVSPEGAAELLGLVPGSRFVEVPHTGHMVAGDDNDVFTQEVLAFLDSLS